MPKQKTRLRRYLGRLTALALLGLGGYCAMTLWLELPDGSGNGYYWESHEVGDFKAGASAVYRPHYPDLESALLKQAPSPYEMSLNGSWRVTTVANPGEVFPRFFKRQYDVSEWTSVKVPHLYKPAGDEQPLAWCCKRQWVPEWLSELAPYLHGLNPPYVPVENNSTRLFRRSFDLPENWQRKQVRINFANPRGAFSVWVNGVHIGYAEGDGGDYEFDISTALRSTGNTLVVAFTRWSDADYLVAKNSPLLRGFGGSVRLKARNSVHFKEVSITKTKVGDGYKLDFASAIAHEGAGRFSGTLEYYLLPPFFKPTAVPTQPLARQHTILDSGAMKAPEISANLKKPVLWYPETPALYTLAAVLRSDKGKVMDVVTHKLAFREAVWRKDSLQLNGQNYRISPIQYEPIHPKFDKVMGEAEILADMRLMKLNNVNAIYSDRMAYPNVVLDAADELGFLVIDTLGVEPTSLTRDYGWEREAGRRLQRSMQKNWQRPSVVGLVVPDGAVHMDSQYIAGQYFSLLQRDTVSQQFGTKFVANAEAEVAGLFTNARMPTDALIDYRQKNALAKISLDPVAAEYLLLDNSANRLPMQNNYRLVQRTLYKNGKQKERKLGVRVDAGEQFEQPIYVKPGMERGKVAAINFELRPVADSKLLNRADKLQVEQVVLSDQAGKPLAGVEPEPLKTAQEGSYYEVFNPQFKLRFNTLTGELVALFIDGENILAAPVASGLVTPVKRTEVEPRKDQVRLKYYFDTSEHKGAWEYLVYNDGRLDISLQLSGNKLAGDAAAAMQIRPTSKFAEFSSFAKVNGERYFEMLKGGFAAQPLKLVGNKWLAFRAENGAGILVNPKGSSQRYKAPKLTMPLTGNGIEFSIRVIPASGDKPGSAHAPPRTWRLPPQDQPRVEFHGPN